ncbi:hypothetical protein C8J56DRAFT_767481 [Mycena floridula]|nr:hypothetical protein C8J56DRAFT_767481 [Mycena floridula]
MHEERAHIRVANQAIPAQALAGSWNQQNVLIPTQVTTQLETDTFWPLMWRNFQSDPRTQLWLTFIVFLIVVILSSMTVTMSLFVVVLSYCSLWITQIAKSIRTGKRSRLRPEYVIGTTVCRLYLLLYFLACPKNVRRVEPCSWSYFLALFVMLQALVVLLQDMLGPTFFLPTRFAFVTPHDYHPLLPQPDPEGPEQSFGGCVICMSAIYATDTLERLGKNNDQWKVKYTGSRKRGNRDIDHEIMFEHDLFKATARKSYSLSPCHHLFVGVSLSWLYCS